MSFFSRKAKREEEENRSFFALEHSQEDVKMSFGSNRNQNPDVLTPEEILRKKRNDVASAVPSSALDSLKKRMQESRTPAADKDEKKEEAFLAARKAIEQMDAAPQEEPTEPAAPQNKEQPARLHAEIPAEKPAEETVPSLLERCRVYTTDENGNDKAKEDGPTYRLESVADILKAQSQTTMERLTEKYDISFDNLGKIADGEIKLDSVLTDEEEEEESAPAVYEPEPEPEIEPETEHTVISDFELAPQEEAVREEPAATVRFTPVTGEGHASKISVSSTTKTVDLTGELAEFAADALEESSGELQLERTEFDEYTPEQEFHNKEDGKALRKTLAQKRRKAFIKMTESFLLALVPAVLCLPFLSGFVLGNMRVCTLLGLLAVGGIAAIQWEMFTVLPKLFTRHATADAAAVTATLSVLIYAVVGILSDENVLPVLMMLAFALLLRAIGRFFRYSVLYGNYMQIASRSPKRAVKLIRDPAVAVAMARDSIEGDVLIAAPQKTDHVDDYMKYSTFRIFLGGKMPLITVIFALLSLILGFAAASFFKGAVYGFYSAAAIQCLCAAPVLFLIEDLPLFSAAGRLGRIGSMIAGKAGAEFIADANAIVLTSEDLFPAGTVSLHKMQVLSQNSIDDTLIRAAALTDAMKSPLASVLKKIVGTDKNVVLPKADTVKYEKVMGISGWVDNRLLFVGNHALMVTHGIQVPDFETDKKLLREGYFPVYVADADRACALLAIQYEASDTVAHELRKISAMGITMLIENSDPNMTEEMICDHFGLYEDSVKVMSAAGCHMYKSAAAPAESVSAPAAYKGNPIGLAAIVNAANRIRKANLKLIVLYLFTAVLGAILFTYLSFDGKGVISGETVLLYELICTVLSLLIYFFEKP